MANKAIIDQLRAQIKSLETGVATEPLDVAPRRQTERGDVEADSVCRHERDGYETVSASRGRGVAKEGATFRQPERNEGYTRSEQPGMPFHEAAPTIPSERRSAFGKIVDWVNARDRSEKFLRERLVKDGYEESEIDDAVARAKDCGIIDDSRYAHVLIRSRLSQGKGAVGIERELLSENISPSDVEGWPYEFDVHEESEFQRALALLDKNPTRSKNKREGAFRKLVQKGFATSVASSAARAWSEGNTRD